MTLYDLPIDPPCDAWRDYEKPEYIKKKIQEICFNIGQKGQNSSFSEIFDLLYEHIEEDLEKFLPDEDCHGSD